MLEAEGDAIDEDIPMVVLVDGGSASASEIVTGALRDRGRATVVGTRTFGKGLVQEVEPLSNGGVLDITVANYYLPGGKTISTAGIKPEVRAADNPTQTATRRFRRRSTPCSSSLDELRAQRASTRPLVAVLEKRGRFLVAEPLFGRGPRGAVEPRGARVGDLVLVGAGKRGARVIRTLGRPDRARDVLEGLMLDRGLHRDYPRSADAEAEHAAGEPYAADDRVDLTGAADLHDRPRRRTRLRRRHLGRARGRRPYPRLGAHRRRDRLRAPGRPARRRGLPARHERLRAGRGRADAAGGALEPGLLAAARARSASP